MLRPVDRIVKQAFSILKTEYVVIGRTRVRPALAWLVIAFFVGITVAIGFLASRSGTFEGAEATVAYDEIRLDFRYLRDYFDPQVTGLQFHREIKCRHFKDGNCSIQKFSRLSGATVVESIAPFSFNASPYTITKPLDSQNGIIIWKVPRLSGATTQYKLFVHYYLAGDNIETLFEVCPTDAFVYCGNKLQKKSFPRLTCTDGTGRRGLPPSQACVDAYKEGFTFSHKNGVNETIKMFGIDRGNPGGFATGKHSVRPAFFDEWSNNCVENTAVCVQAAVRCASSDGFDLISCGRLVISVVQTLIDAFSKQHPALGHFNIKNQFPVNTDLALDCNQPMISNYIPGTLGQALLDSAKTNLQQKLNNLFRFDIRHLGDAANTLPIAITESDPNACSKNPGCGHDGTSVIMDLGRKYPAGPPLMPYSDLLRKNKEFVKQANALGIPLDDLGAPAFTNYNGYSGSQGNNYVAYITNENDIGLFFSNLNINLNAPASTLNRSIPEHELVYRVMTHELTNTVVSSGMLRFGSWDANKNLVIPPANLTSLTSTYKHCAAQATPPPPPDEGPSHPLISVEQ